MLALGDVGGKSEYVLRNSGRVAQERELHAGPDNSGITSKVALLAVETFDFTPRQGLVGLPISLEIVRMRQLVECTERNHLFGRAAKHAPVSGIDGDLIAFDLGDSDPQLSTFKDGAKFLFTFADGAFKRAPLRDVKESDHGTNGLVAPQQRMGPVFNWKTAAVAAPEHFIIAMRALPGTESANNLALLHRESPAIRVRMMEKQMAVQAENLIA